MPEGKVSAWSLLPVPYLCFTGDMDGDGVSDIVFLDCATDKDHVYKNDRGKLKDSPAAVGFGPNWTLY